MEYEMEHETAQFQVLSQFSNYARDIEILVIRSSGPAMLLGVIVESTGKLEFLHANDAEAHAIRAGAWGGRVPPTFKLPRDIAQAVLTALHEELTLEMET